MTQIDITNEYFEWLYNLVSENRFGENISYRKLLMRLHDIEFKCLIPMDLNRADDGMYLRYRFAIAKGYEDSADIIIDILDQPCSVLEMMIALAVRCEEDTMDDSLIGNRTGQWFWGMIVNLGLGSMNDRKFDKKNVDSVIDKLLNREYNHDGRGGLFTIKNCADDLRTVEIWTQLCWYLDSIT